MREIKLHTNCQKTLWKRSHLLDLGVDGGIILKGILKTRMWRCILDSYGLGQGQVIVSSGTSVFIK